LRDEQETRGHAAHKAYEKKKKYFIYRGKKVWAFHEPVTIQEGFTQVIILRKLVADNAIKGGRKREDQGIGVEVGPTSWGRS